MKESHDTDYLLFRSRELRIGDLSLGGLSPVRVQSMTNTPTLDTDATVQQAIKLHEAGCELLRITARNRQEARHLSEIKSSLLHAGVRIPLAADIHFLPEAALEAARRVEKIRINPGNYERSNAPNEEAKDRLYKGLKPLVDVCHQYGTAIRVGVNQGSLSSRIVEEFGNTVEALVASAIEYITVFDSLGFHKLVVSIKSSSPSTGIRANRLLAAEMFRYGFRCPIHIGVTEAGFGEDGVLRSALGLAPLLSDGIGDTLRVSLTGDPEKEIPVAKALVDLYPRPIEHKIPETIPYDPVHPIHREKIVVFGTKPDGDMHPDILIGDEVILNELESQIRKDVMLQDLTREPLPIHLRDKVSIVAQRMGYETSELIISLKNISPSSPIIAVFDPDTLFESACHLSKPLMDGLIDGLWPLRSRVGEAFQILQAAGLRRTRVEVISCPSCGRTQFDIESMANRVKELTEQFSDIKIAVMGCIVNGPGEMEDADYGYVGAGKGKVNLYKKGDCVEKGLEEEIAVERLLRLIEADKSS